MGTRSEPRNRAILALGAVFTILALAACSGSAAAPAQAPDGFSAASAGPALSDKSGGAAASGLASQDQTGATDQFIVRTGSISIEVPKIDDALLQVRTAIAGLGGYVSDSDQTNQGDQVSASITYRVPVARWQDALDAVAKIATKVVSSKTNAVEVTGQVLDLGARIDNLRTTEAALQAIMARATKITDVLEVESKLSDVQGQIEQLTTAQTHLKDQASLATLTVVFGLPPTQAVTQASRGWDPGAQLDQASAALLGIGQALVSAGIWLLIVGVPLVIVLLIVLGLVILVGRRIRRSRPATQVVVPPTDG